MLVVINFFYAIQHEQIVTLAARQMLVWATW